MNHNDNNKPHFNTDNLNFDDIYELCEQEFSHQELINMLKFGNIPMKQIAAIKLDCIKSEEDAHALINNLTGCDGKIREAVAYKIHLLLQNQADTRAIFANISSKSFADATIDINANICRRVIDSAILLKQYQNFATNYADLITKYTLNALEELDKFIFKDKKYTINKQLFKLYWCLEALIYFYEYVDTELLNSILEKCASQKEYTIREKTAQILVHTNKFSSIKDILKNDDNYYVNEILNHQ